ncbi:MAG: hypothetical protein ABSE59_05530 [Opitutaceae bacterium]|jgi:hypothetical protein
MADPDRIKKWHNEYALKTDDELIAIIHENSPTNWPYVAAQQILTERRLKVEKQRHDEIIGKLEKLKKPHWTVSPNFWITVVSAIAAVLAAYFAYRSLPLATEPPRHEGAALQSNLLLQPQTAPPKQTP